MGGERERAAQEELTEPANLDAMKQAAREVMMPEATQLVSRYALLADQLPWQPGEERYRSAMLNSIANMRAQVPRLPDAMGEYFSAPPAEARMKLMPYQNAAKMLALAPEHITPQIRGGGDTQQIMSQLQQIGHRLSELANPNSLLQ